MRFDPRHRAYWVIGGFILGAFTMAVSLGGWSLFFRICHGIAQ